MCGATTSSAWSLNGQETKRENVNKKKHKVHDGPDQKNKKQQLTNWKQNDLCWVCKQQDFCQAH